MIDIVDQRGYHPQCFCVNSDAWKLLPLPSQPYAGCIALILFLNRERFRTSSRVSCDRVHSVRALTHLGLGVFTDAVLWCSLFFYYETSKFRIDYLAHSTGNTNGGYSVEVLLAGQKDPLEWIAAQPGVDRDSLAAGAFCKFDGQHASTTGTYKCYSEVHHQYVTCVTCIAPAHAPGSTKLDVSLNGIDFTHHAMDFEFFDWAGGLRPVGDFSSWANSFYQYEVPDQYYGETFYSFYRCEYKPDRPHPKPILNLWTRLRGPACATCAPSGIEMDDLLIVASQLTGFPLFPKALAELVRLTVRSVGGHSYTALESSKVEFCAVAVAPVIGPYSGNTPVTIRYQGKIPQGQNEIFCFFGSKRVTSDSLYYNADDDTIVRAHCSHASFAS
eukprot:409370-Prorocentrum_minimum.AAC.1